jgi:transcription-repair coupling factor (superfamily II helicase)
MNRGPKRTSLQFADTTPASPDKIVKLIKKSPAKYSVTPDNKLVFEAEAGNWRSQLKEVASLANQLR